MVRSGEADAVSAVVVAYNGGRALHDCVRSLLGQTTAVKIIIVDNASTDGSVERASVLDHGIQVIRCAANGGYAAGANVGWRAARNEHVVILNQDLTLLPDCLEQMRGALLASSVDSLVTPKLVLKSDPGTVNAIGNCVHSTGIAWCNGMGSPASSWHGVHEVTAVSGAAIMARRSLLEQLGGLEESYFMYMEDVDLSLRARAHGATCLAACDAVAAHDWRLRVSPAKFGLLERNRRRLWQRFFGRSYAMYPFLVQAEMMGWAYAVLNGRPYLAAKMAAGRGGPRLSPSSAPRSSAMDQQHPYSMLFPSRRVVVGAGLIVDRAIWALARVLGSLSRRGELGEP